MKNWEERTEWLLTGKNCTVEVSHHTSGYGGEEEGNRWCVYAHISVGHPFFSLFSGNGYWQEATELLPLHQGCTFLKYHFTQDSNPSHQKCAGVQVGADYNHLYDYRFSGYAKPEEAYEVFEDAQVLLDFLENYQAPESNSDELLNRNSAESPPPPTTE